MSIVSRAGIKSMAKSVWQRLRGGTLEPRRTAASVAVGAFVGCLPVYGLQTPLCAALTLPARLDFPLACLVMLFANPITAAPLAIAEIELGAWLLTGSAIALPTLHTTMAELLPYLRFLVLGSVVLGAVLAVISAAVTYRLAKHIVEKRARAHSTTRTESM